MSYVSDCTVVPAGIPRPTTAMPVPTWLDVRLGEAKEIVRLAFDSWLTDCDTDTSAALDTATALLKLTVSPLFVTDATLDATELPSRLTSAFCATSGLALLNCMPVITS